MWYLEALAENTGNPLVAGCQMVMVPVEWPGLLCRLPCSVKDNHIKKKKQKTKIKEKEEKKNHPAVQRREWVNPSVVSFHVEVMISKSFGTRLPGWRRDGWMSGVITEYPCSWLIQTSWLLEIKLLCLHVRSWIKVEGPPLSGVWDQAGIFINIISWKVLINNLKG